MQTCKHCDAPHKNKVFCSPECQRAYATAHKAFYEKNCELCGKYFSGGSILKDVRFCSDKCARVHVGSLLKGRSKAKNPNSPYLIKNRICPVCNEKIPNIKSKYYNQRCSIKCDTKYKQKLVIDAWKADPSTGTAKQGGLSRAIRSYLIKQANGKCNRCGRSDVHPVTGNYVIEVDHVDGNRYNNAPENLEVLCGNCHSLTPTFKGGNARGETVVVTPKPQPTVAQLLALKPVIGLWLDDDSIHNGKDTIPQSVREYLIAKAGYKCSIKSCKWGEVNPYTGRIPLEVDHIDGDAHNNTKANLKVLCPQCHALSPFHRALNKNSSRVNRKKNPVTS